MMHSNIRKASVVLHESHAQQVRSAIKVQENFQPYVLQDGAEDYAHPCPYHTVNELTADMQRIIKIIMRLSYPRIWCLVLHQSSIQIVFASFPLLLSDYFTCYEKNSIYARFVSPYASLKSSIANFHRSSHVLGVFAEQARPGQVWEMWQVSKAYLTDLSKRLSPSSELKTSKTFDTCDTCTPAWGRVFWP